MKSIDQWTFSKCFERRRISSFVSRLSLIHTQKTEHTAYIMEVYSECHGIMAVRNWTNWPEHRQGIVISSWLVFIRLCQSGEIRWSRGLLIVDCHAPHCAIARNPTNLNDNKKVWVGGKSRREEASRLLMCWCFECQLESEALYWWAPWKAAYWSFPCCAPGGPGVVVVAPPGVSCGWLSLWCVCICVWSVSMMN